MVLREQLLWEMVMPVVLLLVLIILVLPGIRLLLQLSLLLLVLLIEIILFPSSCGDGSTTGATLLAGNKEGSFN